MTPTTVIGPGVLHISSAPAQRLAARVQPTPSQRPRLALALAMEVVSTGPPGVPSRRGGSWGARTLGDGPGRAPPRALRTGVGPFFRVSWAAGPSAGVPWRFAAAVAMPQLATGESSGRRGASVRSRKTWSLREGWLLSGGDLFVFLPFFVVRESL